MDDKLKKLEDLIELYKSNSITKEEYDLLKNELLIDSNKKVDNNSAKPIIESKIPEQIETQNNHQEKTFNESNRGFISIIVFCVIFILFIVNIKKQENPTEVTAPDTTTVNSTIETSSNTCSICGRNFSGNGYEEISEGVWQLCDNDHQSYICSTNCGRKHDMEMNRVLNKYNINTNSNRNDGRVYESNACSLCKGTGIESGRDINGDIESRVCPMCSGRGVRSY